MISIQIFPLAAMSLFGPSVDAFAFVSSPARSFVSNFRDMEKSCVLRAEPGIAGDIPENSIMKVSEEEEDVAIPFLDTSRTSFIECYADSVAIVDGVEYTIGVPCDYTVALCYQEGEGLFPVDINSELMDDIFPIAEHIIMDEFEDELELQRTPQTLTLVGELEEDDEDEDDEYDDLQDGQEKVEVLLEFEHEGRQYNLVRLFEPILIVGKQDDTREDLRVLLTPEESDRVMPILEDMFLSIHEIA